MEDSTKRVRRVTAGGFMLPPSQDSKTRRQTLRLFALAGLSTVAACSTAPSQEPPAQEEEEEVSPAEDLMREHGVLNRILLVYEESIVRLEQNRDLDPAVLSGAAGIIRNFIEDYHEKLEEDYLFPRFEKVGRLTDLVTILRNQHQGGRVLTESTLNLAKSSFKDAGERDQLAGQLKSFIRMYRPHEAREDTVLFPALRQIVSANEYASLGEEFEDKEHDLFGEDGFENMVEKVGDLERQLGIHDLAQFTPKAG